MPIMNTVIQGGGTTPTGTKQITSNGTHDVAAYEYADVQVPTTAPEIYQPYKAAGSDLKYTTPIISISAPLSMYGVVFPDGFCQYSEFFPSTGTQEGSINVDWSGVYGFNTGNNNIRLRSLFAANNYIGSIDLSGLVSISPTGNGFLEKFCRSCEYLTTVNLHSCKTIGNQYNYITEMFYGCTRLTSLDLSSLDTLNVTYFCYGCTSLTSINLSSLQYVYGNATGNFSGCTSLTNVTINHELPMLTRNPGWFVGCPLNTFLYDKMEYITTAVTGLCAGQTFTNANAERFEFVNVAATNMFKNNTNLESASFPRLTRWNTADSAAGMFEGCTNINFTRVDFPMLCVFKNTIPFTSTSFPSQVTVHFRKDQQSLLGTGAGYSSNYGAAAVVFDLVGTITVNGTDYVRQGKENETGYYAWQKSASTITEGGVVYTFDISQITRNTAPDTRGPVIYGWVNGSTTIYTDTLKPQVGDYIYPTYSQAKSTTRAITAVDSDWVYTVNTAEPDVGDNAYGDTSGTVTGTISAIA